jgi:hypothetical protein
MNATHLRNMFMPPEGEEMTGYDPVESPELLIDKSRFQR